MVIAAAVAAGVAARRRYEGRAERLSRRILSTMLYVLYPPVVFFNLARLHFDGDVLGSIAIAWVAVVVAGVIAYLVGRHVLHLPRPRAGTLINTTLHPNTGYLGLPVCAAALGPGSLDRAVAYDTLVAVPTLLIGVFGVGAAFGTIGDAGVRARVRRFLSRNPPLWAAAAGLLAPAALAPDVLVDASRALVYALLPLGFFAVGVTLAGESVGWTSTLGAALGLRLLVAPAVLIGLTAPFVDLPDPYLVVAAMPTGVNGLVVAHAYGLDVGLQASAAAYGTAIVVPAAVVLSLVL